MPNDSVWGLYPALGVLFAMLGGLGLGARSMWREYTKWKEAQDTKATEAQSKQDKERTEEREKQREWEAEQDALRDERWQSFIAAMKVEQAKESEADRKSIADLAAVIRDMSSAVGVLTETLKNHILEDTARFDVLLTPEQKASVDVKTQPRKK